MLRKLFFVVLLGLASTPGWTYSVSNGKILDNAGKAVTIKGVNWFGFQTTTYVVHGLWQVNWHDQIALMKQQGINAIRLPFCPATLRGVTPNSIDYTINPDLQGLNSLQLMDKVVEELSAQGMMVLLDHHSPDCQNISELWYTSSYSETQWINDLKTVATRYRDLPGFLGIDLKNELYGSASWGSGNAATDWNRAAERAAAAILPIAPKALIFVEGINQNTCTDANEGFYWGENISPQLCTPLNIPADRLVLSPHVYGPDVYVQSYFNDASYPSNLPAIWNAHWAGPISQGYAVVIGEFGGKYGEGDSRDVAFQDSLTSFLNSKGITGGFYWSWNPNSGDTGGVLRDDWVSLRTDKVAMLQKLWAGTADGGSAPAPVPTPAPAPAPAPSSTALTAKVTVFDDWTSGYCATATVTNGKSSPVTWTSDVAVEGTIFDLWSAVGSGSSGAVRFSGVSYNETLQPGASTDFGWCANRSAGAPAGNSLLPNAVKITNDWGSGYCATVTVQNSGSASVTWATDVKVDGTLYAYYGATPSANSGTIRFTGADYNQTLEPGKSSKFGLCANRGG